MRLRKVKINGNWYDVKGSINKKDIEIVKEIDAELQNIMRKYSWQTIFSNFSKEIWAWEDEASVIWSNKYITIARGNVVVNNFNLVKYMWSDIHLIISNLNQELPDMVFERN